MNRGYAALANSRPLKQQWPRHNLDHRGGLIVELSTSHQRDCPVIFTYASKPRLLDGGTR